ncbi:MAG TPA: threonine/serine dehydratase [Saprospiraceae bacterium]|nr:threonine/serine dehydratase [Saprospiraceae bacterium]
MNITAPHIEAAENRIRDYILDTPLLHSTQFSQRTGADIYLKLENHQYTGSFKARGAMNKVLSFMDEQRHIRAGIPARTIRSGENPTLPVIITASTGNHGLGVARAIQLTGLSGKIYIPENASPAKVAALKQYPVELITHGRDSLETELYAKQMAHDQHATWISPYNDPDIIAGQGTIGIELTRQLENIRAVYVTVGGGGLISGIATWFAEYSPQTEIIGCLPENSPEMKLSVEAGHVVHLDESKPTLSDGSAGGMENGSITFPICQKLVKRYLLVSEKEIADAIHEVCETHGERIEGAAGVAVAAMMKDAGKYKSQRVVAIVCGGNIEKEKFWDVVKHEDIAISISDFRFRISDICSD